MSAGASEPGGMVGLSIGYLGKSDGRLEFEIDEWLEEGVINRRAGFPMLVEVFRATGAMCLAGCGRRRCLARMCRSEEHTSELQSLMRISYAVFCLKKKKTKH